MNRLPALLLIIPLVSCESEAPTVEPAVRVDAGAVRARAASVTSDVNAELERVEEKAKAAAPAQADAGQKSGVNE